MTIEEAKSIARLIGYADGACSNCVGNLVDKANEMFPDFKFTLTGQRRTDRTEWDEPDEEYPSGPSWLVVDVREK